MEIALSLLMSATLLLTVAVASSVALWITYLACMNLKVVHEGGSMTRPAYWLGILVVAVFYLLDFFVNAFVCSVIFGNFPRELTVTERLNREFRKGGWRADVAMFVAKHFLNTYDPSGQHCDFLVK
jgi:hypothetical protein